MFKKLIRNLTENSLSYFQRKSLKLIVNNDEEYKILFLNNKIRYEKNYSGYDFLKANFPILKNTNLNLTENILETLFELFGTKNKELSAKLWKKKRRFIPKDDFLLTLPPEYFFKALFDEYLFKEMSLINKFEFLLKIFVISKYSKNLIEENIENNLSLIQFDFRSKKFLFKEIKRVFLLSSINYKVFFKMDFRNLSILSDQELSKIGKFIEKDFDFSLFGLLKLKDIDLSSLKKISKFNFDTKKAFKIYENRNKKQLLSYKSKINDYEIEVLSKDDVLGFYLGYIVKCCQKFNSVARTCIEAGFKYSNYSFLIIRYKGTIIAHSLLIVKDKSLFIDSIETHSLLKISKPYKKFIEDMMQNHLEVFIGGNKLPYGVKIKKSKPNLDYILEENVYSDLRESVYRITLKDSLFNSIKKAILF